MATIDTSFKNTYASTLMHSAQQNMSRLREAITEYAGVEGDYFVFDELNALEAHEVVVRNSDTIWADSSFERRRVALKRIAHPVLLDNFDKLMLAIDPTSDIVKATVNGLNRKMDDLIIDAFEATVATGYDGTGSTTYDSDNTVASGTMTVGVLRSVKQKFDENEMLDDNDQRYIVVAPAQINSLLGTTEVGSYDYNSVKALVQGEVDTFMGFKFIISNRLTLGSGVRTCYAWCKSAVAGAMGKDIITKIDEIPTKNYNYGIYSALWFNALRLKEEGVSKVSIDEA